MSNMNLNRQELENIYGKINPFEFKNKLIELATISNRRSRELYLMLDVEILTGWLPLLERLSLHLDSLP